MEVSGIRHLNASFTIVTTKTGTTEIPEMPVNQS